MPLVKTTGGYQIVGCDWFPVQIASDDHLAEPLSHVSETGGESQHSHDLTGDCDVKLTLRQKDKPEHLL